MSQKPSVEHEVEVLTELRPGALKFPGILMQGITHIAPAVGLILSIQFITSTAGVLAPLAYFIAFLIMLTLGVSLMQLARHLPSAGGYYTYISRTIHPQVGFLVSWLYFLYDPPATAINLAFMGFITEAMLRSEYGVRCPWWLFFIVGGLLLTFLVYRGVELSTGLMIVFGVAEILIVVALSCFGVVHPGPGGMNVHSYALTSQSNLNGLSLGVVFSIFSFTGFDGVAPLAEESENPRKNLPRAIMGSLLFMGAFYLFCSWAVLIGWGTDNVKGFIDSQENPCFVLARKYWGRAWILTFVAVLNSVLGVSISCMNAATRVFFAMGRSGALPKSLAYVHPHHRTPVRAIWLQTAITFAVGLGLGFWIGPDQEFYFMGVAITLSLVLIYSVSNYGVFRFYRGERRAEFRVWQHLFCPLFSTIALICVGVKSVIPLPNGPLHFAPLFVGLWIVLGVAMLVWNNRNGRGA